MPTYNHHLLPILMHRQMAQQSPCSAKHKLPTIFMIITPMHNGSNYIIINNMRITKHNKEFWLVHKLLFSHSGTQEFSLQNSLRSSLDTPPPKCLPWLQPNIVLIIGTPSQHSTYHTRENLQHTFHQFTSCLDCDPILAI